MTTKDRRSRLHKALDWITLRDPRNPQYVALIPNPDAGAGFDTNKVLTNLDLYNVVKSVVNWISGEVSKPPLVMYRRNRDGGLEPVADHPMLKVLRRPNPDYRSRTLLKAVEESMLVCGNAYIRKVRFNVASRMQLQFVPPWVMRPKLDNDGYIIYYERDRPRGAPEQVPIEDVIHFRKGLDQRNPTMGISPFSTLGLEIWTDERASVYTAGLLKNHGRPGLIMSVPAGTDPLSPEVAVEMRQYVKEQFTGANTGETLFMSIPLNIEAMGLNPSEMSLTDVRNTVEERVCASASISPAVIPFGTGLEQTKVGATMQEVHRMAWGSAVIPDEEAIAEQLLMQLLPEFERQELLDQFELAFDLSGIQVLQLDLNRQAERWRTLVGAVIATQGEAREAQGLKVGPEHDVFLYPLNVVPVPAGELPMTPEPEEPEEPDDDEDNAEEEAQETSLSTTEVVKALLLRTKAALNQQQRELLIAEVRLARRLEAALAEPLIEAFDDLGRQVAELYRTIAVSEAARAEPVAYEPFKFSPGVKDGARGYRFMYESSNGQHVYAITLNTSDRTVARKQVDEDMEIVGRILMDLQLDEWQSMVLEGLLAVHYRSALEGTVGNINSVLGLGVTIPDTVARRVVAEGGTRLGLLDISRDTRESIFRALHAGRSAGEGPSVLARRIRDQVSAGRWSNAGPRYRAMVIARTETKYAQNVSTIEAYKQSDAVTALLAVDAQVGNSDAECEARDGQVYSFEDAQRIVDHPNGTLSWSPVVVGG